MRLQEWLETQGVSCSALARQIGVPTSTVWRIALHGAEPRASTALAIIRATKRKVKLEDLVEGAGEGRAA